MAFENIVGKDKNVDDFHEGATPGTCIPLDPITFSKFIHKRNIRNSRVCVCVCVCVGGWVWWWGGGEIAILRYSTDIDFERFENK